MSDEDNWRETNDCKGRILVAAVGADTIAYTPVDIQENGWYCMILYTSSSELNRGDVTFISSQDIRKSKELFPVVRYHADVRIYFA